MAVRWSNASLADLDRIWHFNAGRRGERIDRADAVQTILADRAEWLSHRPFAGRRGTVAGTREHLLRDLQYVVIYTVEDAGIRIARVLSTRERP